jgi:hypothetical protein
MCYIIVKRAWIMYVFSEKAISMVRAPLVGCVNQLSFGNDSTKTVWVWSIGPLTFKERGWPFKFYRTLMQAVNIIIISTLSDDRSTASSKIISPLNAI